MEYKDMRILALDPAATTGWAFGQGETLMYGLWKLGPTLAERPRVLAANIRAIVERFGCDVLAYELATHGGKRLHTMRAMNELSGAILSVAADPKVAIPRVWAFNIGTWKARAVGKGNAKKWGVQRGLQLYHGLKIDQEDMADAVGILKAAYDGPPPEPAKKSIKALVKKLKASQPLLPGMRGR